MLEMKVLDWFGNFQFAIHMIGMDGKEMLVIGRLQMLIAPRQQFMVKP